MADNTESEAVNRSTYTPAVVNVAVVDSSFGLANVVDPGPDTCDHVTVTVAGGAGRPSSDAEPTNAAPSGNVTV